MSDLDNRSHIKEFDSHNYLSHILETPDQIADGYSLGDSITIPALYAQSKQVLFIASGDLLPVAQACVSLMLPYARVPVYVADDYAIPKWVSRDTLVFGIDYSGDSENVVSCFRQAAAQHARLFSISISGEIAREARRNRAPNLAIEYGAPPRAAFSYFLTCLAVILKKLDLIDLTKKDIADTATFASGLMEIIGPDNALFRNTAKQLAEKIALRKTIIIGSGSLVPIAGKWQVDFAASAKKIATCSTLNTFNSSLINALEFQTKANDAPAVILLQSKYDHGRNKLQQTLTYQVAQAQKFVFEQIFIHPSGSLFGEMILTSLYGDFVAFYLAWLLNKNPSLVELSQFITEHLSNQPHLD
jgi:glucose/mannose-6-phosphate isomerase